MREITISMQSRVPLGPGKFQVVVLVFKIKSLRDLPRNVMVTWLRNQSAAKIFVVNEISVSLQKKNALIE